MKITHLNIIDFGALIIEYQAAIQATTNLNNARRYKRCIAELKTEIALRKAKSNRKSTRKVA